MQYTNTENFKAQHSYHNKQSNDTQTDITAVLTVQEISYMLRGKIFLAMGYISRLLGADGGLTKGVSLSLALRGLLMATRVLHSKGLEKNPSLVGSSALERWHSAPAQLASDFSLLRCREMMWFLWLLHYSENKIATFTGIGYHELKMGNRSISSNLNCHCWSGYGFSRWRELP